MTETKMEMRIISAVSNILPNTPLEQALHRIMEELGPPHFDDADKDFAAKIRSTLTEQGHRRRLSRDRHGTRPTGRWPISSCRWTPSATR